MINPKTGKTVIANAVPGIGHPLKLKPNIKSGIAKGLGSYFNMKRPLELMVEWCIIILKRIKLSDENISTE